MTTLLLLPGVKVALPSAWKVCPVATVAPPLKVASPVTPSVPPTVPFPVTAALFNVAKPLVERVEREVLPVTSSVDVSVVAPVTPNVPPTVALPVTDALFKVAKPDVESVESEVLPLTFNVPAMTVLPFAALTVNLSVFTAKLPVTPSVPPTVALLVTDRLFKVASPLDETVEREVLPRTLKVPPMLKGPLPAKV